MTSHRPLSLAVVGLGFGRAHVAAALELPGTVELVGVVDLIDPRADDRLPPGPIADAVLAVPHRRSLGELLADGAPDIVAIATPIHTHASLATEALTAGSHVLLEKPPTVSLEEHRRLLTTSRETGRSVQVGFQARGGGGLAAMRALIASGELGEVTGIGVVGLWVRNRAYYQRARWAGRRTLDGVAVMDGALTNPFAHAVDAALVIDGAVHAADIIDVEVDAWHAHDIAADDTTSVVLTTAAGTRIAIGLTLCAGREVPDPVITVHGTRGSARLEYTADRLTVVTGGRRETSTHSRVPLLRNLAEHVTTGAELVAPLEATEGFTAVLEAVRFGPEPRAIPSDHVVWEGSGAAGHPVVSDVEEWCERVASTGLTFTRLGAPWTAARALAPEAGVAR